MDQNCQKALSASRIRLFDNPAKYDLSPSGRVSWRSWSSTDVKEQQNGDYTLIKDVEDIKLGKFDKPLPCCGCGIGWFSLLLGFVFPFMWYYATVLYFGSYYHKDPRERAGLAANAIAAFIFTIAVMITVAVFML